MARKYGWIITEDIIGTSSEGVTGPRGCVFTDEQLRAGTRFKMYDDDNILYYEGCIVGEYSGDEPLMDYGMPNAGCTRITLRMPDGSWEHCC